MNKLLMIVILMKDIDIKQSYHFHFHQYLIHKDIKSIITIVPYFFAHLDSKNNNNNNIFIIFIYFMKLAKNRKQYYYTFNIFLHQLLMRL